MTKYVYFYNNKLEDDKCTSPVAEVLGSKISLDKLNTFTKSDFCKSEVPSLVMVNFLFFCYDNGLTIRGLHNISDFNDNKTPLSCIDLGVKREPNIHEFVYKKDNGQTEWRKIDIMQSDDLYVKGEDVNDNNKFKSFKRDRIVGNRLIKVA